MLFGQLGDLHKHNNLSFMDNFVWLPLVQTSFISRSLKDIVPMERHMPLSALAQSQLSCSKRLRRTCMLQYRPIPTWRAIRIANLKMKTEWHCYNCKMSCIPPDIEPLVLFMTSIAQPIYTALHHSLVRTLNGPGGSSDCQ